ncbi:MAG TPA: G1 family glutamic endopeptidase [Solirubrobacteraceae bacterium]|nr:G1 family glutamic endopeptidase [Solirubrobacteraceae bacterium]
MTLTRSARALLPAALLAGALIAAPAAAASQLRSGANHVLSRTPALGSTTGQFGAQTDVQSSNWSGYAATGAGPYKTVSTSWIQPAVNCSATPNSYAAFWDGLDGYSSSTVEQTGTLAECSGSNAVYSAWYETYPNPMETFSGDKVSANDALTATVTAVTSTQFVLTLTDKPANGGPSWTASTTQTIRRAAALSSAEVIAEAPSDGYGILPLADFSTVSFGTSIVNGGNLASASGLVDIQMATSSRRRTTIEATPSAISSGGFSVTWDAE